MILLLLFLKKNKNKNKKDYQTNPKCLYVKQSVIGQGILSLTAIIIIIIKTYII